MPDDDNKSSKNSVSDISDEVDDNAKSHRNSVKPAKEVGGRHGPDPTRYGDWEKNGRCVDF